MGIGKVFILSTVSPYHAHMSISSIYLYILIYLARLGQARPAHARQGLGRSGLAQPIYAPNKKKKSM